MTFQFFDCAGEQLLQTISKTNQMKHIFDTREDEENVLTLCKCPSTSIHYSYAHSPCRLYSVGSTHIRELGALFYEPDDRRSLRSGKQSYLTDEHHPNRIFLRSQ